MKTIFESGAIFRSRRFSRNAGVSTLIRSADLYPASSNTYANLVIGELSESTPVEIADSGHRSRISKTNGQRRSHFATRPGIRTSSEGEVATTTSASRKCVIKAIEELRPNPANAHMRPTIDLCIAPGV